MPAGTAWRCCTPWNGAFSPPGPTGSGLSTPCSPILAMTVFGPSAEAVAEAKRLIEDFDEAARKGEHVAVLDGRMVEALHAADARRLVAFAEAIASFEAT